MKDLESPLINEHGQTIGKPTITNPPSIELEDWQAILAEQPWLITESIWNARHKSSSSSKRTKKQEKA